MRNSSPSTRSTAQPGHDAHAIAGASSTCSRPQPVHRIFAGMRSTRSSVRFQFRTFGYQGPAVDEGVGNDLTHRADPDVHGANLPAGRMFSHDAHHRAAYREFMHRGLLEPDDDHTSFAALLSQRF